MSRSRQSSPARCLPCIACLCLAVGAGAARAEPARHDIDGFLYATGEAADHAESAGLKLRRSKMAATFVAREETSPLHLATFRCAFVSHTTTDTATRHQARVGLTGACLVTDRAGDSHVAEWHRTPGEDAGRWIIARGTGKYATAQGAGSYTITFLSRPPDAQLRFALTGELVLE